jgi:beta-lactamase superfamily II metal-dependent hydrolase
MGIEIDFLAVGDQSKSGDAIALRYGNLHGLPSEQKVVVVDGGYQESGERLVEFIRTRYGTTDVDLVISTHPDQDHVGGLEVVVEELNVRELWMHQPWAHSLDLAAAKRFGFSKAAVSEALQKSLEGASELEAIATRKSILIREPFTGLTTPDGIIEVAGPTLAYYEELLAGLAPPPASTSSLAELLRKAASAVVNMIPETLWVETLRDDGVTQPQNNSSVITLIKVESGLCLLTADAGIPALEGALDGLEGRPFRPGMLDFVHIPHHGSRRNVGPSVLNRLLGPKGQPLGSSMAFVSAAKEGEPKHPAKKVTNAFHRRGYNVLTTQGANTLYRQDAPDRPEYGSGVFVPFYDQVEEDAA